MSFQQPWVALLRMKHCRAARDENRCAGLQPCRLRWSLGRSVTIGLSSCSSHCRVLELTSVLLWRHGVSDLSCEPGSERVLRSIDGNIAAIDRHVEAVAAMQRARRISKRALTDRVHPATVHFSIAATHCEIKQRWEELTE